MSGWGPGTQHIQTVVIMRFLHFRYVGILKGFVVQVPGMVSLIIVLGSCLLILATFPLSLIFIIKVVQVLYRKFVIFPKKSRQLDCSTVHSIY